MAGPSIGTWVKVRNKSGRMTARVIANKFGGGSYEQGQVITQSEYNAYKEKRAEGKSNSGGNLKNLEITPANYQDAKRLYSAEIQSLNAQRKSIPRTEYRQKKDELDSLFNKHMDAWGRRGTVWSPGKVSDSEVARMRREEDAFKAKQEYEKSQRRRR